MKRATKKIKRIDLNPEQLEALLEQIRERLEPEQYEIVQAVFSMVRLLSQAIEQKGTSIRRLLKMMFGSGSERTRTVLNQALEAAGVDADETPADPGAPCAEQTEADKKPKPGHGRNGAIQYTGAQRIPVALTSPCPGQRCPECGKGKLYPQAEPAPMVRVVGQAPLQASIHELERARCGLCGKVLRRRRPPRPADPSMTRAPGPWWPWPRTQV